MIDIQYGVLGGPSVSCGFNRQLDKTSFGDRMVPAASHRAGQLFTRNEKGWSVIGMSAETT